ncbi:MAG: protease modulator HflC [Thermodesulfobacteriota bacterium]
MNKRKAVIFAAAAAAVVWLATGVFTIDQTQVGVVARFGKVIKLSEPGLNVKLPWPVDKIYKLDSRLLYMSAGEQEILTQDQKTVVVGTFLVWKIENPELFVKVVKTRAEAEARLRDLTLSQMGSMVGNLQLSGFVGVGPEKMDTHVITKEATAKVNETALRNMGVSVKLLEIETFTLPLQNRASVIARMNSERQMLASRYRSEGVEAALKIESKAASEHNIIMSEAHAKAAAILGEADADALKIMGDAYRKNPGFFKFLRSLEGYESIIDEKTTLFIPSDSKLLEVLNGSE